MELMVNIYLFSLVVTGVFISFSKGIFTVAATASVESFNNNRMKGGYRPVSPLGEKMLKGLGTLVVFGMVIIPVVNTIFLVKCAQGAFNRVKNKM